MTIAVKIQFSPEGESGPVFDYLDELQRDNPKAAAKLAVDLQVLGSEGIRCRKISIAPLGGGLWELKRLYARLEYRILFCIHEGEVWLLHAFIKKTRKTPARDLELARQRMKEVMSR
ncbi:type II toxin-antitoxin system RelE/ParE family toxin [bacterium]|nr:type II toxin-antitoxin system RelE/ParE family toxin [bacterium]